jgi:hypothetical protein
MLCWRLTDNHMFYRVKIERIETGNEWITPYYFTKKTDAEKEGRFWENNIWRVVEIISSRKNIGGISKRAETRLLNKSKKQKVKANVRKTKKTSSKRLLKELRGGE